MSTSIPAVTPLPKLMLLFTQSLIGRRSGTARRCRRTRTAHRSRRTSTVRRGGILCYPALVAGSQRGSDHVRMRLLCQSIKCLFNVRAWSVC